MKMPAEEQPGVPRMFARLGGAMSMLSVLSVWYALLYVVIEGYQEAKLHDEAVDELLAQEDYVSALRRFRNATFHYQGDPIPKKVMEFLTAQESEMWIRDLNRAFNRYLTRELHIAEDVERWKELGEEWLGEESKVGQLVARWTKSL
ncbi:MAG TPA: hypothetical protein VMF12_18070 [Xanthobacteraceae bacterium]|nr:hypothetical protein [Xanthobacteraceae bacterium]